MTEVQYKLDHYTRQWEAIKQELVRHSQTLTQLREEESSNLRFTPREDYLYSSLYSYKFELHASLRAIAQSMVISLARIAEKHMNGSSNLSIDTSKLQERFTLENDRDIEFEESKLNQFHPLKVWEAMEAEYGGGKGEEEGFKQAARQIIEGFSLYEGDSMTAKSGYFQLDKSMYLDSSAKQLYGKNKYSYSCQETLRTLITGLEVFLTWAASEDSAFGLKRKMRDVNDYHAEIVSRGKYVCGDDFMFVTYQNRIEFRFLKNLGEQLQVFLGLYGTMLTKGARW